MPGKRYLDRKRIEAEEARDEYREKYEAALAHIEADKKEREHLVALLKNASSVLTAVQWASWEYSTGYHSCPVCQGYQPYSRKDDRLWADHRNACKLKQILDQIKDLK